MLLQSLYNFSKQAKYRHGATIFDTPEFESRYISWLIDLDGHGRFKGLIPLMGNDEPGMLYEKLPRTLEAKDSGTISEFLVEDIALIFGLGDSPTKKPTEKACQKQEHFWSRIVTAHNQLQNANLQAIINFKNDLDGGKITSQYLFFEPYQKTGGRGKPKEQWVLLSADGRKIPLYFRPNTSIDATFRVNGEIVVQNETVLEWWKNWFNEWLINKEVACLKARGGGRICVITGEENSPISNSHLPKIKLRGPNTTSFGATFASAEAASYHSYGLSEQKTKIPDAKSGSDASYTNVSVRGAISYCNALNYILENEDHHLRVGPLTFCFWCNKSQKIPAKIHFIFDKADPRTVKDLLLSQFAGVEPPQLLQKERFYSAVLAGNSGRIMVKQWIDQSLIEAIQNLRQWWDDLQITSLVNNESKKRKSEKEDDEKRSPYSLRYLASATIKKSKKAKDDSLVSDRLCQLYLAALLVGKLSITLLKPILDEFYSALVKDDESVPTYPFNQSRFALIKLILIRNRKEGDFMPTPELCETDDPAYNLGRLLAVFENLQDKYHDYEKKGAGVVERYYSSASTAPATAFPILCRLARHHLSKLKKGDESDKKAAFRIEENISNILGQFKSEGPSLPPAFPRFLTLEKQGRFALGFYQQKACRPKSNAPTQTEKETQS